MIYIEVHYTETFDFNGEVRYQQPIGGFTIINGHSIPLYTN